MIIKLLALILYQHQFFQALLQLKTPADPLILAKQWWNMYLLRIMVSSYVNYLYLSTLISRLFGVKLYHMTKLSCPHQLLLY